MQQITEAAGISRGLLHFHIEFFESVLVGRDHGIQLEISLDAEEIVER